MPRKKQGQLERKLCSCGERPVAINYVKDNVTHYRSLCSSCSKKKRRRKKLQVPNYSLKPQCEKCGFVPKFYQQLDVYHNKDDGIIKTVCLNCQEELNHTNVWSQGDLVADF